MNFLVKVFLFFLEEDSFSSRLEKGEGIMEIEVGSSDSSFLNEARGSMERCKLFLSSFEFLPLVLAFFTREKRRIVKGKGKWFAFGIRWGTTICGQHRSI